MKEYKVLETINDFRLRKEHKLETRINELSLEGYDVEKILIGNDNYLVVIMSRNID